MSEVTRVQILNWATEHYFLTFLLIIILSNSLLVLIRSALIRTYRFIVILCRGWPTNSLMDADGDIIVPKPYLVKEDS